MESDEARLALVKNLFDESACQDYAAVVLSALRGITERHQSKPAITLVMSQSVTLVSVAAQLLKNALNTEETAPLREIAADIMMQTFSAVVECGLKELHDRGQSVLDDQSS